MDFKRAIAAAVCAAAVLSLAGCGKEETSTPANTNNSTVNTGTSTPKTESSAPQTSSASESKPEESSAPEKPEINEDDFEWKGLIKGGELVDGGVEIVSYKGDQENIIFPAMLDGMRVTSVSGFNNDIDIKSITISAGINEIKNNAFADCLNLEEVIFLGDIEYINGGAFANCVNLEKVTFLGSVPQFFLSSFENTPWLEKKLEENTDPNLYIIENVLVQANKETIEGNVVIPDGVTRISSDAFRECKKITGVTIPDSVTEIGTDAFFWCSNLSSVKLSANITEIKSGTFAFCGLISVDVPDGVTTLGSDAFGLSSVDTVVNLPDSIIADEGSGIGTAIFKGKTYENSDFNSEYKDAIKQNAIEKMFGDKDFIITDNVLMKVNPNATKIELPDSVTDIADDAFDSKYHESIIITFKGKKYNLANLDKLREDVSGN